MLSPVTPLNPEKTGISHHEDRMASFPSARCQGLSENSSAKCFHSRETNTRPQPRGNILPPQPILPNVPSRDVITEERNEGSRWKPSDALGSWPCGPGPRTGLRTQPGYRCAPRKPLLSTHNAEGQNWMTH